jgi:hypothetical protein
MTTDDDESFPLLEPDDHGVRRHYLGQLEWRFPSETAAVERSNLQASVYESLRLCVPLRIKDPKEVLRFIALVLLLTPEQKRSQFFTTIIFRVLVAIDAWGASKRMRFIYKFLVGRAPPDREPDFGVWFVADPRFLPPLTQDDLKRAILSLLPGAADPLRGG